MVEDPSWANLKIESGDGGFVHINSLPKEERINIKSFKNKVASGDITPGGTKDWTTESWERVRACSRIAPSPWTREEKEILKTKEKMSAAQKGEKNSQYGKRVYIHSKYTGEVPPTAELNKQRYYPGKQPTGWILLEEWRDQFKDKTNSAYGKKWYNDGIGNHYLYPDDPMITDLNLIKKRLNTWKDK